MKHSISRKLSAIGLAAAVAGTMAAAAAAPVSAADYFGDARDHTYSIIGCFNHWQNGISLDSYCYGKFNTFLTFAPGTYSFKIQADDAPDYTWGMYEPDNDGTLGSSTPVTFTITKQSVVLITLNTTTIDPAAEENPDSFVHDLTYEFSSYGYRYWPVSYEIFPYGDPDPEPEPEPEPDPGNYTAPYLKVSLSGAYYTDIQNAIDRINEIRYEACLEGVKNPERPSTNLTMADYSPIQWSHELELTARQRAAEAVLTLSHTRPNGSGCFSIDTYPIRSNHEVLAWNFQKTMVYGLNQFYQEKTDWVNNTDGVTGHYEAMINPSYRYVGLGEFYSNDIDGYPSCLCGRFSSTLNHADETRGTDNKNVSVSIDVNSQNCSDYKIECTSGGTTLNINTERQFYLTTNVFYESSARANVLGDTVWASSDESVATVSDGKVTALKTGQTTLSAVASNGIRAECTLTVVQPARSVRLDQKELSVMVGNTASLKATIYPKTTTNKTLSWTSSDKQIVTVSNGSVKAVGIGTATITVITSNNKKATCRVTVLPKPLVNKSTIDSTSITYGDPIRVRCSSTGGTGNVKYAVFYKQKKQSNWTKAADYSSASSVSFIPKGVTTYNLRIKAKDEAGLIVNKDYTVTVKAPPLLNTSFLDAASAIQGSPVRVVCRASGGIGTKQFAVFYKQSNQSTWTKASDYSASPLASFVPRSAAVYNVRIKVKDGRGKIVNKDLNITVKASLRNTSRVSAATVTRGSNVTVSCSSTGAAGTVQYAVFYKQSAQTSWTMARNYATGTNVSITLRAATTYNIRVKAKDASGKIVNKDLSVIVK